MDDSLIIVLGFSAGGIDPALQLLTRMPADLPATIFVVTHRSLPHTLAQLLDERLKLRSRTAADLDRFEPGYVYVCPGDQYLSLENGIMRVEHSPKESVHRPSINALFRSAAHSYGRRVVGILLSGLMNDGSAGLWQVKKHGGITIVQDPNEAAWSDIPQNAIDDVDVDFILPIDRIADKLIELARDRHWSTATHPPSVLIVEDEALVAHNLRAGLQTCGYAVAGIAESGERAIALAEETRPSVVLMDIRLPGAVNGIDAARRIWDRMQIPIVFLTAYTDDETLDQVGATEHYGYVAKPARIEAVQAAIELALSRREKEARHR